MTIEDINYLKANSIKQSYTFLVDSESRNRSINPSPSEYFIEFSEPFKNVIDIEVLDVTIPKTMHNVDYNNNKLYYYISQNGTNDLQIDENGNYDESLFSFIEIPPGDYKSLNFIETMRSIFFDNNIILDFKSVNSDIELTNTIFFESTKPFVLDMSRSTVASLLGFDEYASDKHSTKYEFKDYNKINGCEKLFHSVAQPNGSHSLVTPGMMYLLNNKYILLRCPEIENHLYRSLAYSKYNLGLAKIRINSYGFNEEKTSFLKVPLREFHPIGKLIKLTIRFETPDGNLYDFKGVNHNMVLVIYYYEPVQGKIFKNSIINPEYKNNFIDYMYKQEDQEGDSDEENDLSRDDIDVYKRIEQEYSRSGIENKNATIAYKTRRKYNNHKSLYNNIYEKVSNLSSENDESEETTDDNYVDSSQNSEEDVK